MRNLLRIVPPAQPTQETAQMAAGTKFILPSGQELGGVVRCEIVAEVNNVYRCNLEIIGQAPETFAEMTHIVFKRPPIWMRMLEWIVGNQVREITDMRETEYRQFELAKNL